MTRILIVDDHPLVIEGVKSLLVDQEDIIVVGVATNAFDAMVFLKENQVDIAFLDINLPDISGIDLCKKIKEEFPDVKSIALSTFAERSYISRMVQNGAMGYLLKSSSKDEILDAISQVSQGGYYLNLNIKLPNQPEPHKPLPFLTRREKEVLILISDGFTNHQIAEKLFVSVLTVDSHRKNLLMKFEVNNTASLIKIAVQNDLI
ncbi:DNA-binding response regulator [Lacihabitans sp. LS3-19]|uniref:response regulator n=1 Tax=Lacihabitans sp. LS3-19 TaxID=2487335 RepID=UPI0020CF4231|nr:response regulator transcription factor [Lacihabitans sp. LS3-19]MCP9770719.1 DNA-binding response regulator [Lacihabitans sp. LS3-19]